MSNAPAWVQAVGSVIAILIAAWVPWWQRRNALRDARSDRALQEKEHLQRLTVGLRAEIEAARAAANRRHEALEQTLSKINHIRERRIVVKEAGPIQPGSLSVTDAIVYKQMAPELGRFPPELIRSVVTFYSLADEVSRIADAAPTAVQAFRQVFGLLPRLKTHAAIVVRTLDKFEAAGFSTTAPIAPDASEVRQFAADAGYPLDQIAEERGIKLPP